MKFSNFNPIDFGRYLGGMFFAGACIMGAYGIAAVVKSIKGIDVPLAIAVAIAGYLWWPGERLDTLQAFLF